MKHGTEYRSGHDTIARRQESKNIEQEFGRIRSLYETNKERQRGKKRQNSVSTTRPATDGFLKSCFLPKLAVGDNVPDKNIETGFYLSLSNLCTDLKLTMSETEQMDFPYNVALAFWDAQRKIQLKGLTEYDDLQVCLGETGEVSIGLRETYNTKMTLYYIPVAPLYHLLRDGNKKRCAKILISVCSYLYHIVNIPYYRQECSYLYWQYEMFSDWIVQDEDDTEDYDLNRSVIQQAEWLGDFIERKLLNTKNLDFFKKRVESFKPQNALEHECFNLAKSAFDLYLEYPNTSIFRYVPTDTNIDEENGTIHMEQYISFVADTKGFLYETLFNWVNSEFNECSIQHEPTIYKAVGDSKAKQLDFDFESKLFALLDDLTDILNNYKEICDEGDNQ